MDDDPTVAEVVASYLDRAGFAVERAADGPSAVARAAATRPDLVVLDLMLPGMDGLEVCRRLREAGPLPVVMLTARGDEDDRILGLEVGADDYVTKPFSPRELVLRVESVLRRAGGTPPPGPWLRSGSLALDPAARRALRREEELALTIREFDLLAFFLRHPGRVLGREELMRRVWGWEFGDLSTVTVHVRRLREKIEEDPARPRLISTVWGVGYRFDPAGSDGTEGPHHPAGTEGTGGAQGSADAGGTGGLAAAGGAEGSGVAGTAGVSGDAGGAGGTAGGATAAGPAEGGRRRA